MDKLKSEDLNGIYEDFAQTLGVDCAIQLYSLYKGQQISFPVNLLSREYMTQQIVTEYNGSNEKYLAAKYGYSERWVREIIKKQKERTYNEK